MSGRWQPEEHSRSGLTLRTSGPGSLPLDSTALAAHVVWKLESRADVLHAIPQLIANIEHGGAEQHSGCAPESYGDRDLAVRSIFALTNLAHNARLRTRICETPGLLSLVVQRAILTKEPSLSGAYMGLLSRLTARFPGGSLPPPPHQESLLDLLAARATAEASANEASSTDFLGVLANLTRGCLEARSYMKSHPGASDVYRALTQLLVGPGTLCIVLVLQTLANLVLHEPLGAILFAEDNLRRIFEIVFSLVKDASQSEHAHHALRAGSNLLSDLFLSPRVLELVGRRFRDIATGELTVVFETIATLCHSLDPALPLLELVCALSRAPPLRAEVLRAACSERAQRAMVLPALLSLAACPHVDVVLAATEFLTVLCQESYADLRSAVDDLGRAKAVDALAGIIGIGIHRPDRSVLDVRDTGESLTLRQQAACRLLRELARTGTFRDDVQRILHPPSMVSEAKAALQRGDGSLALMILLLGFQCWEVVLVGDRQELLLLARSPAVVDTWSDIMSSSKDTRALHECLLVSGNLLFLSHVEETRAVTSTRGHAPESLPAWIETQTLVNALAANHGTHDSELERLRLQLRLQEEQLVREKEQVAQLDLDRKAERRKEVELRESERQRHLQELQASAAQLVEARKRGDEGVAASSRDSANLVKAHARCEATERKLEDAEITHADLLQRALKAENLCRQLTAKLQEKETQLQQANEDREGLLSEVELRQNAERGLAEASEAGVQMKGEIAELRQEKTRLQRENASLTEAHARLTGDLRKACAEVEERGTEAQRRASLLDVRAEDLERRLTTSSNALRAAETARDDAVREVAWLRCELATFQRFEHDREYSRFSQGHDADAGWQASAAVEQRLRQRAEQAHSNALEFKPRGRALP